jgi:hypothetical protein
MHKPGAASVNSESGMIMQAGHGLQVDRAEKALHPQDEPTLKVKATQFDEWVPVGKATDKEKKT